MEALAGTQDSDIFSGSQKVDDMGEENDKKGGDMDNIKGQKIMVKVGPLVKERRASERLKKDVGIRIEKKNRGILKVITVLLRVTSIPSLIMVFPK